jgi:hypothetical protein
MKIMLLKDLNVILNFAIIVSDVSTETAINANDIVSTLQALGMLKYVPFYFYCSKGNVLSYFYCSKGNVPFYFWCGRPNTFWTIKEVCYTKNRIEHYLCYTKNRLEHYLCYTKNRIEHYLCYTKYRIEHLLH